MSSAFAHAWYNPKSKTHECALALVLVKPGNHFVDLARWSLSGYSFSTLAPCVACELETPAALFPKPCEPSPYYSPRRCTTTSDPRYPCIPSSGQVVSELIVAPPPPWPSASTESSTPQQPSTNVLAAFITPKKNKEQAASKKHNHKPSEDSKPPLAEPEADFDDFMLDSLTRSGPSGGLFLEEEGSKRDTVKRCPPG